MEWSSKRKHFFKTK